MYIYLMTLNILHGTVVYDLDDMTYEEVAVRLAHLMFISHQSRWVDMSLRNFVGDWLCHAEEHFAGVSKASMLQPFSNLDKPSPLLEEYFKACLEAKEQLVASKTKPFS